MAGAAPAGLVALGVVLLALGLRLATREPTFDPLVPSLVAAAFLSLAGLVRRGAPTIAGLSIGIAALLGAIEVIAVVRGWLPIVAEADRAPLVGLATAVGLATTLVSGWFMVAWSPRSGVRNVLAVAGMLGVVGYLFSQALITAPSTAAGLTPDDVTPLRLAIRVTLGVSLLGLLVGSVGVVISRLAQAWLAVHDRRAGGWTEALAGAFAPWLRGGRRAGEVERARIAADLHARVVPELRRAAEVAEAGDASAAHVRLQAALDDVEQLMASRHSVVLEQFGLVAALEWLAEKTEQRATIDVFLDVDPASTDDRPPADVERACFRVALLAVDNAVRHAAGSSIGIAVRARRADVRLAIRDAGPGFDPAAVSRAVGEHRGLADLRAEAKAIGASVDIGPGVDGRGTTVALNWTA